MADGTDCYQAVKDAGLYRECKRTQGVSTTELVGRMLLMTRDHHKRGESSISNVNPQDLGSFSSVGGGKKKQQQRTTVSHFLPTSKRIVQFSEGREPKETDRIVYVDGTFDLFHIGHIEFLKRAKALGDFLIVGVHDDQVYIYIEREREKGLDKQIYILILTICWIYRLSMLLKALIIH